MSHVASPVIVLGFTIISVLKITSYTESDAAIVWGEKILQCVDVFAFCLDCFYYYTSADVEVLCQVSIRRLLQQVRLSDTKFRIYYAKSNIGWYQYSNVQDKPNTCNDNDSFSDF